MQPSRLCLFMIAVISGCGGSTGVSPPVPPPPPILEVSADLSSFVTNTLSYIQGFSEGYVVPSAADLGQFDSLVQEILRQQLDSAKLAASAINFELIRIIDTGASSNELYCLREITPKGQGFYCVDFDSASAHHISVPHPLYDRDTNMESVVVMRGIGARYLSVSTTHRCSNAAASSCSGTTTACGASAPYKVSDVAHNVDTFFHHFGVLVHDRTAATHTIQLHGCGAANCPSNHTETDIVARISAGTTDNLPDTEFVNVLNSSLNDELAPLQMGSSLSCSEAVQDKRLCGTTNPLGRYINGQSDPCQNPASTFVSSRWLHVEQNRNLRVDDGAGDEVTPDTLVNAINNAFGAL